MSYFNLKALCCFDSRQLMGMWDKFRAVNSPGWASGWTKKPPACLRASACILGFSNPATAALRWLEAGNILLLFVFFSGSQSLCLNSAGFLLSNLAACPQRGWAHTKTDAVTKTQRFPLIFNGTPCGTSLFNINRKMTSLFIEVLCWIRSHLPVWLPDLVTWAFGGKKISPLPYC